ncbi:polysaccharide biosynthesis protein [Hymenobacter sp. RP-2-7]|uniref:Polysaccharide biosynthesis protein n=1 Tax=Hymenobacter polaris TaxID=2682546 RepID=A0A7Y0AA88_9BACT|nr:polysaccharide biosynthesis protein [Hymenobacter polaris]NML63655.1 polysaccharide biosynthesis protein [Hymenobacter polaris]
MKNLASSVFNQHTYAKGLQWSKLIVITGGSQVVIQLASLICGILIIRLLSTQEYALYTLANTMLGTMIMLADNGISSGVMAEAGKVWLNKEKSGIVLATGLRLRNKFAIYTLIITLPILGSLLIKNNATWIGMILITLSIIPAFFAALSDNLLEIAPKLHQDINSLQKNQIEVSILRLILNTVLILIFPFTFIALIANGIPRIYGNYKLKKISSKFIDSNNSIDYAIEREVMKAVKRTLPIVIYHCLSGQISIWLISLFGTTSNIAQYGALGRLSVIFSIFSTLFSTLVVPRFSRMEITTKVLLKRFSLIQLSTTILSLIILFCIWLLSNQMLWILGNKYKSLNTELILMSINGCLGFMTGISSQLIISRGWFMKPYYLMGLNFFSSIIFITVFHNASLISILYFNIILSLLTYLLNTMFGFFQISKFNSLSLINS